MKVRPPTYAATFYAHALKPNPEDLPCARTGAPCEHPPSRPPAQCARARTVAPLHRPCGLRTSRRPRTVPRRAPPRPHRRARRRPPQTIKAGNSNFDVTRAVGKVRRFLILGPAPGSRACGADVFRDPRRSACGPRPLFLRGRLKIPRAQRLFANPP